MEKINTAENKNSKVFSLFGKSGLMEKINTTPVLPIGCKIFCYGYGMTEEEGAIISERNELGQYKCVYISDTKNGFFNLNLYTKAHSQKFGIGNYYDDNLSIVEDHILEEMILKAEIAENVRTQFENDKKQKDDNEIASLPTEFPHLIVNREGDYNIAKKNLIAELKKHFPKTKFSVKKDHYSTYRISWKDGASKDEVEDVANKFESYQTDETGDFRDYNPSLFNEVFGGFKYIFCEREIGEEIQLIKQVAREKLLKENSDYPNIVDEIFHKTFRKTSFPFGIKVVGFEGIENFSGSYTDSFKFIFEHPAELNKEGNIDKDIVLFDYSEKSIAVFGDTKSVKEVLKSLGGRFNPNLNYKGEKTKGWIFPKSKSESLKTSLNL